MKLLTVTALKEYSEKVTSIFRKAGIRVFSVTDIVGVKDGDQHILTNNWFGRSDARFDSILLIAFTENEKATAAMQYVREYNQEFPGDFPIRAFMLAVEDSSH